MGYMMVPMSGTNQLGYMKEKLHLLSNMCVDHWKNCQNHSWARLYFYCCHQCKEWRYFSGIASKRPTGGKKLCINCKPAFGDRKIRRLFQSFINVGCFSEKREKFLIPIWGLNSFIQLSTVNAAVLSEKFKNIVTFRLYPVFTKETREVFLHCVRDKKKNGKKTLLVRKGSD